MSQTNLARFIVADVFDGLATLDDGSVDLVVTSPPFLALRSYLPADHPDKGKEIGSEPTPAEWIDTMLAVYAELRRVVADHGSVCFEVGDTYAGSGGAGGDYGEGGWRGDQNKFAGSALMHRKSKVLVDGKRLQQGEGWPLAKSKSLIPQLLEVALAYGINPLTGQPSPAGQWRIRNVVTWARPNPPVGALGKKWRPATSDVVVACTDDDVRYWDDLATRKPLAEKTLTVRDGLQPSAKNSESPTASHRMDRLNDEERGAPLLDYWQPPMDMTIREAIETGWLDMGDVFEIPPGGYKGAHYAVFPPALVEPLVKAMCPERVCRECGEPSRRIVETSYERNGTGTVGVRRDLREPDGRTDGTGMTRGPSMARIDSTTGWTDCGHDAWRPGLTLDPFAGSGTTLEVAVKWGRDAIGFDLDERNADLARERVGDSLFHQFEGGSV